MSERGRFRASQGVVVSDKMQKTVKVQVTHLVKHPRYGKTMRRTSNFLVHDEEEKAKQGDVVEIREGRPFSKRKHWLLVRVIRAAPE